MSKLSKLHHFLCKSLKSVVHSKKIHAAQAGGTLVTGTQELGNGCFLIANWRYDAGILFESFPHNVVSPAILLAMVACWLTENDTDRNDNNELHDPKITVDVNNEETADVLIQLNFEECIELIPDENGLIGWNDGSYTVNDSEIWVAETFELSADVV